MMITGFTGPYTLNARILEKTNHLFHYAPARDPFRIFRSSRVP